MSRSWSQQFKSKEEKAIEEIDAELATLADTIKASEAEIKSGAPSRDHWGVRALKDELDGAIRRTGVLSRKRTKLLEKYTGQNK